MHKQQGKISSAGLGPSLRVTFVVDGPASGVDDDASDLTLGRLRFA